MQVTTITVTRARKVQPEQYGSADASLTLVANLDEGEAWQDAARSLLEDTRGLVYENLGLKLPAKATKASETVQDTVKVETKQGADVPADVEPKPAAKRSPGRPATKKNTTPTPADDIPGDDVPEIRKNPEDRKDPADDLPGEEAAPSLEDEFPDEPVEAVGDYTVGDLQSFLTTAVKDKKISAQDVRAIIAAQGVARTSDLPTDKVLVVKKQIEQKMSA
jgi:hypothetical protein